MMIFNIIFFILSLIILLWFISLLYSAIKGAPTVYAKDKTIRSAFKKAGLDRNQTVLDIGCGNGTPLIIASREFGARGIGIEISLFYFLLAKVNVFIHHQNKKVEICFSDYNNRQYLISKADLIYLYLMPDSLKKIKPILQKHKKLSAKIISISFPISGLKHLFVNSNPKYYIYG